MARIQLVEDKTRVYEKIIPFQVFQQREALLYADLKPAFGTLEDFAERVRWTLIARIYTSQRMAWRLNSGNLQLQYSCGERERSEAIAFRIEALTLVEGALVDTEDDHAVQGRQRNVEDAGIDSVDGQADEAPADDASGDRSDAGSEDGSELW